MYEYRYKRDVAKAVTSLKNWGVDSSDLEGQMSTLAEEATPDQTQIRIIIPIDGCVKEIGKQLGILADQINEG